MNFSDAIREHMNRKFNRNVKREEIKSFYIEEFFGITAQEARETIDEFFYHDDHLNALPVEGAKEVLERLSKNNNLYIVTAKPDRLEQITLDWLQKHYPDKFKKIHFANTFSHSLDTKKRKKSEVCIEAGINLLIDDGIDNAIDVSSAGIPVLLFDTPWNQTEELPSGVTRVFSWGEIEKEINNLL
jgi:uncharacterized HAD superfamily protein